MHTLPQKVNHGLSFSRNCQMQAALESTSLSYFSNRINTINIFSLQRLASDMFREAKKVCLVCFNLISGIKVLLLIYNCCSSTHVWPDFHLFPIGKQVFYSPSVFFCLLGYRPETDSITSLGPPKANSQQPTGSCCALSHIRNSQTHRAMGKAVEWVPLDLLPISFYTINGYSS